MNPAEDPDLGRRHISPFSLQEKIARVLWAVAESTLFRTTWPTWYRYRAWLLRRFGAAVHPTARIRRTCSFVCPWNLTVGPNTATGEKVWFYCLGPVSVGARVTLSHFAQLCAGGHNTETVGMELTRPPIVIGDDAWIATSAFVGPGVHVGDGAILGARGCAFKQLNPWTIYGGNPATVLRTRKRLHDA